MFLINAFTNCSVLCYHIYELLCTLLPYLRAVVYFITLFTSCGILYYHIYELWCTIFHLFTSCGVLYSTYLRAVVYFITMITSCGVLYYHIYEVLCTCTTTSIDCFVFYVVSAIFQPKNCGVQTRAVVQLTYFEGSFPRVLSNVGSEDTGRSEGLTAVHTLVRTLSTVNLQQRNSHQCC